MRDLSTAELARAGETPTPADRANEPGRNVPVGGPSSENLPVATTPNPPVPAAPAADGAKRTANALFPEDDTKGFRTRWSDIQANFVDEPRHAVEEADALVANVMKRLAEMFANERANLEHQWDRGDNVTTEDLRIALQRYRSFFDRLLAV